MPLVSRSERSACLAKQHPVLFKLCVVDPLPPILWSRCIMTLPVCYGDHGLGSPIPVDWDGGDVQVIPLWEHANGLTAIRCVQGNEEFFEIDLETSGAPRRFANGASDLFAELFQELLESAQGKPPEVMEQIERLAMDLEFDLGPLRFTK